MLKSHGLCEELTIFLLILMPSGQIKTKGGPREAVQQLLIVTAIVGAAHLGGPHDSVLLRYIEGDVPYIVSFIHVYG